MLVPSWRDLEFSPQMTRISCLVVDESVSMLLRPARVCPPMSSDVVVLQWDMTEI